MLYHSFAYSNDEPRPVFDIDPLVGLVRQPSLTERKRPHTHTKTTQEVVTKRGLAAAKFGNRLRAAASEPGNTHSTTVTPHITAATHGQRSVTPTVKPGSATAPRGGFSKPTAASLAKAWNPQPRLHSSNKRLDPTTIIKPDSKRIRATSNSASPSCETSPTVSPLTTPRAGRTKIVRRNSLSGLPDESNLANPRVLRTKHSSEQLGLHARQAGSGVDSSIAVYDQFWRQDATSTTADE